MSAATFFILTLASSSSPQPKPQPSEALHLAERRFKTSKVLMGVGFGAFVGSWGLDAAIAGAELGGRDPEWSSSYDQSTREALQRRYETEKRMNLIPLVGPFAAFAHSFTGDNGSPVFDAAAGFMQVATFAVGLVGVANAAIATRELRRPRSAPDKGMEAPSPRTLLEEARRDFLRQERRRVRAGTVIASAGLVTFASLWTGAIVASIVQARLSPGPNQTPSDHTSAWKLRLIPIAGPFAAIPHSKPVAEIALGAGQALAVIATVVGIVHHELGMRGVRKLRALGEPTRIVPTFQTMRSGLTVGLQMWF